MEMKGGSERSLEQARMVWEMIGAPRGPLSSKIAHGRDETFFDRPTDSGETRGKVPTVQST